MLNSLWDAEVTCDSPYDPSNKTVRKDGLVFKLNFLFMEAINGLY